MKNEKELLEKRLKRLGEHWKNQILLWFFITKWNQSGILFFFNCNLY